MLKYRSFLDAKRGHTWVRFDILLDRMGVSVILVSAGLCLAALGALICLRARPAA